MRERATRTAAVLTVTLLTAALSVAAAPAHADRGTGQDRPDRIARQIAEGLQAARKGSDSPGGLSFDPALALLPAEARGKVNFTQADVDRGARGKTRAAERRAAQRPGAPREEYTEKEPEGTLGANDTVPTAETIADFGTGRGESPVVAVTGGLAEDPNIPTLPAADEDNGAIPLAADTGVTGERTVVRTTGTIGDGPHGSAGDGHGDFDFYKVSGVPTGVPLTIDLRAEGDFNGILRMYDANGGTLFWADDPASGNVAVSVLLPSTGDWYLMVGGSGPNFGSPLDPDDSASGAGAGSEGGYALQVATEAGGDQDVYTVDLAAGDVLGATVTGSGHHLSFLDADGTELMGSSLGASAVSPAASPTMTRTTDGNTDLAVRQNRKGDR